VTDASLLPRARCRSCGATIHWVMTERGRAMPIDVKPNALGNVVFKSDGRVRVTHDDPAAGETRWLSHFATCPHAREHRVR
jgi:hypothetical protein